MSTYTPIATQTLSSTSAAITFSSIPQGYTDLVLVIAGKNSSSTYSPYIQFNGDTSTNYSSTNLYGDGTSAASNRSTSTATAYFGSLGATQGNAVISINNYSNSTTYKTSLIRINDAGFRVYANAMLWRSTAAITSVNILNESPGTFAAGSTFSLYGIAVGNSSAKADGGNTVVTDGTYWYHAFKSSGAFIPRQALTADVLVIAGGGGGGKDKGGGGGAGGVSYQTSRSCVSNTSYTVVVGAGGPGSTGYTTANATGGSGGSNGSNSIFDTITSVGGGLGGTDNTTSYRNGASGGSGGGATRDGTIGSATQGNSGGATGYGNNGGTGTNNSPFNYYGGGGGGGAGAAGTNGGSSTASSGGAGLNTWSSWASATGTGVSGYYAGGGGAGQYNGNNTGQNGGTGGAGGGGAGGGGANGQGAGVGSNAVTNTGSGGGGGGDASNAGSGGSGIVIIRYAV